MGAARGSYIVWLNDDTYVGPRWLETMVETIEKPHPYHPNVGLTGPLSNNVAGLQAKLSTEYKNVQPQECPAVVRHLHEKSRQVDPGVISDFAPLTKFLSGFCLMMKREVYDKVGDIDELYSPGGFCDNDFCNRAVDAGYGLAVSTRSFVFHYGSVSLDRFPEMHRGVGNWHKYVAKGQRSQKKKSLLLVQRLKIDDKKTMDLYKKCSEVNKEFVDGVLILSDKSELLDFKKAKEIWGDKLVQFMKNNKKDKLDEIRDRKALYNRANELDFDWVIMLDHDEALGASTTRERLQFLMKPLDPSIRAYQFLFNHYWKSYTLARTDDTWGTSVMGRMWQNRLFSATLREKLSADDAGMHCGNRPLSIAPDMAITCDLVIEHYGYSDADANTRKKKWYEENDNLPDFAKRVLVGENEYAHLTDEVNMEFTSPKPFTISANIMMKDEELDIGRTILDYWSIIREWVLIDTGSTDRTKEFLDSIGFKYYEEPFEDSFSKVRNSCIEKSTQKYCIHMDPDERLEPNGGLERIVAMLTKDPDICLWHLKNVHKNGHCLETIQPRIFRRCKEIYYSSRVHETLEKSLSELGYHTQDDLGVTSTNMGFLEDNEQINKKLDFYGRLLTMEVAENPDNAKAWFELALHHRNREELEDAERCILSSLQVNPNFVVAQRELALMKMTEAFRLIEATSGKPATAEVRDTIMGIHEALKPWVETHIKVGK
jgi:hypothetical protein